MNDRIAHTPGSQKVAGTITNVFYYLIAGLQAKWKDHYRTLRKRHWISSRCWWIMVIQLGCELLCSFSNIIFLKNPYYSSNVPVLCLCHGFSIKQYIPIRPAHFHYCHPILLPVLSLNALPVLFILIPMSNIFVFLKYFFFCRSNNAGFSSLFRIETHALAQKKQWFLIT